MNKIFTRWWFWIIFVVVIIILGAEVYTGGDLYYCHCGLDGCTQAPAHCHFLDPEHLH